MADAASLRRVDASALYDPVVNLELGTRLLAAHLARYGDQSDQLALALSAYNAGVRAVQRHRKTGARLPTETERYAALITSLYAERHQARSPSYAAWRRRLAQRAGTHPFAGQAS